MSSTNQNQTKSNNNNSKSGKTAVPQAPRPTGVSTGTDVAAAINLSHAQSTAAHKRLAARKATKATAPEGEEGGEMDVEQATAPEGEEGGVMDIEQATAPEGEEGGEMDVEQAIAPEGEEGGEMDVEQATAPKGEEGERWLSNSGGKKSPKKNSKKRGHQDEVEETAGTETGGVSEAVSQSKRQKKAHKGSTRAQMPPPKEILTRKRGPKASKGKGKATTTEVSTSSRMMVAVKSGNPYRLQVGTSIPGKLAPPPDVTGSPSLGYEEGIRWGRHGSDSQIDL
ncbi:hypothetical protein BKA82DRAFT_4020224 [Pisolithus tinctorius]|nr:hypothetical protein BKA82DRAFT_4020224 [Pisolithus tinctorius]